MGRTRSRHPGSVVITLSTALVTYCWPVLEARNHHGTPHPGVRIPQQRVATSRPQPLRLAPGYPGPSLGPERTAVVAELLSGDVAEQAPIRHHDLRRLGRLVPSREALLTAHHDVAAAVLSDAATFAAEASPHGEVALSSLVRAVPRPRTPVEDTEIGLGAVAGDGPDPLWPAFRAPLTADADAAVLEASQVRAHVEHAFRSSVVSDLSTRSAGASAARSSRRPSRRSVSVQKRRPPWSAITDSSR